MDRQLVAGHLKNFEACVQREDDIEFWYARDIAPLLEYKEWRNFQNVIEKAKEACENSSHSFAYHFVDVNKMVSLGSGAIRELDDIKLTRYACYLIAMNGDPKKQAIAFAQSYFAFQTRKQELIEERLKTLDRLWKREELTQSETRLSANIYQRGVDARGFATIRSKGDTALFGGNSTKDMKEKLGVPDSSPLADYLPTLTIAAKNLATEITNHNVESNNLQGERKISDEHVTNNTSVRGLLVEKGIFPEALPVEEDLKKLKRKIEKEHKLLNKNPKKFNQKD